MAPTVAEVKREIRRMNPAERWRLLELMAGRFPTSVHDAISRLRDTRDIPVIAWVITPEPPAPEDQQAAV